MKILVHISVILVFGFLFSGCAEKRNNTINKVSIQGVHGSTKAFIILQTTPLIASKKLFSPEKKIDISWLNTLNNQSNLNTKNYQSVYISPLPAIFNDSSKALANYQNVEIYIVDPGEYSLRNLKYSSGDFSKMFNAKSNIAEFTAKGGEVLYIGNLIIDIKNHLNSRKFLQQALTVEDNYDAAKAYIEKMYPSLASRLQKSLIRLPN